MYKSLFAVVIGGSIGCVIRWILSMRLNALFPIFHGTTVVNLVGGFIIGMALAFLSGSLTLIPHGSFYYHRHMWRYDNLFHLFC